VNQRKLIIVSGKGGVGKSIFSASIAKAKANEGLNVLLVELGESSNFSSFFGHEVTYKPTKVANNLSVAIWDGERCLREYLQHLVKIEKVVGLFFDNKIMKAFLNAAPALRELAIMGKFTSGARGWGPPMDYDLIVMDAFATGHFLALLNAPKGMNELFSVGPMSEQSKEIIKAITDKELCKHYVVTIPEELPTSETIELVEILESEFNIFPIIVGNRWLETNINLENIESNELTDFISYLKALSKRQEACVEKLSKLKNKFLSLPLVFEVNPKLLTDKLSRVIARKESSKWKD